MSRLKQLARETAVGAAKVMVLLRASLLLMEHCESRMHAFHADGQYATCQTLQDLALHAEQHLSLAADLGQLAVESAEPMRKAISATLGASSSVSGPDELALRTEIERSVSHLEALETNVAHMKAQLARSIELLQKEALALDGAGEVTEIFESLLRRIRG